MQPGLQMVRNATGKPEAVLTAGQWDLLSRAVDQRWNPLPQTVVLQVDGREFTAYVKEKAGEMPGVAAASDLVANYGRYSRMRG